MGVAKKGLGDIFGYAKKSCDRFWYKIWISVGHPPSLKFVSGPPGNKTLLHCYRTDEIVRELKCDYMIPFYKVLSHFTVDIVNENNYILKINNNMKKSNCNVTKSHFSPIYSNADSKWTSMCRFHRPQPRRPLLHSVFKNKHKTWSLRNHALNLVSQVQFVQQMYFK